MVEGTRKKKGKDGWRRKKKGGAKAVEEGPRKKKVGDGDRGAKGKKEEGGEMRRKGSK